MLPMLASQLQQETGWRVTSCEILLDQSHTNINANENKNESIVSTLDSLYKIENKENVTRNEKEISNVTEIKEEIKNGEKKAVTKKKCLN